MTSALDSLGRSTGRRFNMAGVKRELEARAVARQAKADRRVFAEELAARQYALLQSVRIAGWIYNEPEFEAQCQQIGRDPMKIARMAGL